MGPDVEALERELAAYCGTSFAVAVASGTDALILALRAAGVGPGDGVATSALSFFATAEAILAVGARPVFVDIDPATYTLDPRRLEHACAEGVKAVLPVHLYGHPCEMEPILRLAKARRLLVIEDCAQAIGAQEGGRRVGSFGTAGCLSFYPTKNLGAYGDGGMVVTNDEALAARIRLLRAHGSRERYHHEVVGTNSRLDELQAAILRVKLRHLESWNEARRRHAQRYREAFLRRGSSGVVLPEERPGARHVYHLFCIRAPHRDRLQRHLEARGIGTQVAYPSMLPAQPALAPWVAAPHAFPVAEAVSREVLALPIAPTLTPEAIDEVAAHVTSAGAA